MDKKNTQLLIIILIVSFLLSFSFSESLFFSWQNKFIDFLQTSKSPSGEILIVAIDEQSINSIGQWPWPRSVFGRALEKLKPAKAIGIDVNFKEQSGKGSADDYFFAEKIKELGPKIVLSSEIRSDGGINGPIDILKLNSIQGFTNINVDQDGIVRGIDIKDENEKSFSFRLRDLYKSTAELQYKKNHIRIDYLGRDGTFSHLSFKDVLDGKIPEIFIKDKIIIIGATASDLHDFYQTPFGIISGSEIQANATQTLINENFFKESPRINILLIFLMSFLAGIFNFKLKKLSILTACLLALIVLYNLIAFISFDRYFILDIFYPNLSFILTGALSMSFQYVVTAKEKKFIRQSFGYYLAPQIIEEIMKDPSKLKLGGAKKEVTILFSDIRGFTTISEGMSPEQLTGFLNDYLTLMSNIIMKHGGIIDKYIGDAIMAFWGAPIDNKEHSKNALLASLEMIRSLKDLNLEKKEGDPEIKIGIGLNSGMVTVGNMGSEKRFDYTVIGDSVNLASRLESLNKFYGTEIIVSETIINSVGPENLKEQNILFREIDKVTVKGKNEPVRIYEILSPRRASLIEKSLDNFKIGLKSYYEGNFQKAIDYFNKIMIQSPDDGPSKVIFERCKKFQSNPPKSWEGVFALESK